VAEARPASAARLAVPDQPRPAGAGAPEVPVVEARPASVARLSSTPAADLVTKAPEAEAAPASTAPITEASPAKVTASDLLPGELPALNAQSVAPNLANAASTSPHHAPFKVETPLRDPAWASDFGQKVVWMASNEQQVAQITLNPPDMGPIEISLSFNKDSASAFFVSPHAEVRETIEAALPRLKEMLADVGIQLGQSNVGSESSRQQAENQQAHQSSPRWRADNAILGADLSGTPPRQASTAQGGNGRVDTFA
jgi:flagellar hook-length control protein FliK